ncbi:MAG: PspA/IM30 family protein [Gammaproteobacteria bacterium]|nr:PspA/IM30 family protein [Gammaproteobacteria bacterium]
MALITRISKLFTADVHAVLDRIEEPEVVLKQAIREMTEETARGKQRLMWLAAESQALEQRLVSADETIASLDGELDLCFAADEQELARSLVRNKLAAEQHHKQTSQQLELLRRDHESLEATLTEQNQQLADMQQKADVFMDAPATSCSPIQDAGISQDAIDVAFLREKQRRQS